MGWRKLGDDGQELCRQLDYIVGGLQALKTSIQMGLRLDGEGEMKVNSTELWYSGLSRHRAGDSNHPTVQETQIALRQMKDAKSLLSTISNSLEEAIQTVTDDTSNECRATGLSLLPDDLLTYIFEMYIEMSVSSNESIRRGMSPRVLSSVSKRFRQLALAHSNIWRHVSFRFSREYILLYKDRCPNPFIHVDTSREKSPVEMDKFLIYPYQQWRGLRLVYNNKDEGHIYFEHLKPIIQTPLEALEDLLICNDNLSNEFGERIPLSSHLELDDLHTLSSWQMPNLRNLDLRNVVPSIPLQCGNVTSFSFHAFHYGEDAFLNVVGFRSLLQSMPRIQSLQISLLNVVDTTTKKTSSPTSPVTLPNLTSLKLEIGGRTSNAVVNQVMELLTTKELTRLALEIFPFNNDEEKAFDDWVITVFDRRRSSSHDGSYMSFVKVEDFSLEVERFRVSSTVFHRMFSVMPNVHTVSLVLPEDTKLSFAKITEKDGVFRQLRSLRIKLPKTYPDDLADCLYYLDDFFWGEHCKELEKVEIEYRRNNYAAKAKAKLQKTLGEKLHLKDG